MDLLAKTVLIVDGSAGLGLQSAKLLSKKGCNVIMVGRDEKRLRSAMQQLVYGSYEIADTTRREDLGQLYEKIKRKYDGLHLLIYVAAGDRRKQPIDGLLTVYHAAIGTIDQFLPLLKRVPEAAIVIITSLPALHAYAKLLHAALLEKTRIKVFTMNTAKTLITVLETDQFAK